MSMAYRIILGLGGLLSMAWGAQAVVEAVCPADAEPQRPEDGDAAACTCADIPVDATAPEPA
jgi:hypothetical protein